MAVMIWQFLTLLNDGMCYLQAYQTDNPQYRLSHATLVVTVEDANVHAPVMTSLLYNVTIPEHSPVGYRITQIMANDKDMVKILLNKSLEYVPDISEYICRNKGVINRLYIYYLYIHSFIYY